MFQLIIFVFIINIFFFIFDCFIVITSATCSKEGLPCPNGVQIDYPFWYQNSDIGNSSAINYCGYGGLEIRCGDENEDGRAVMNISNHLYYVQNIDYVKQVLRLVDMDVDEQECPHPKRNVSLASAPSLSFRYKFFNWYIFYNCNGYPTDQKKRKRYTYPTRSVYLSKKKTNATDYEYVNYYEHIPCLDSYDNSTVLLRSYAVYSSYFIPNSTRNCEEVVVTPMLSPFGSYNYTKLAKFGFELTWSVPIDCVKCEGSGGACYHDNSTDPAYLCDCYYGTTSYDTLICRHVGIPNRLKVIIGVSTGFGGLLLSLFFLYKKIFNSLYHLIFSRWQNKTKVPKNVEVLLESYGCLALQRYKYSDIVAMTKSFKQTLGQGGYGCVFKGTLRNDGRLVAVKVLNESKGNGEEFINEVATIGRTNHVNVVSLLGFCIEGNKRALVYEFMPNGSLERFIYNGNTSSTRSTHLGWEKLYQIALGIAKGLEYLHCGCNTRILHFDIKPHNILLDQDFFPKISDFGLAKLCPTRETVVSMAGARGTMGYIAPEIGCRNLGGVSHKSDVYSYGMMVLEMIGGRKNLDVTVENISGIYFPHWIYNQLRRDSKVEGPEDIKLEGAGEILKDVTAKKMIIVALWCIQTHPANRPSITKVVEMLEGSNEELQMPPNPSLDPMSLSSSSSS